MSPLKPAFSFIFCHRQGLAVVSAVLLAGCASTGSVSPSTAQVPVAAAWQQAPSNPSSPTQASLEKWWQVFNDPVLSDLIESALQSSPDIRSALAAVAQARASYRVEIAGLLPTVNGSASDQSNRTRVRATSVTTESETASAGFDASWEIDLFGRQRLSTKAAKADLAQSEENYRDAQVTLAAEVASTYVALRQAETELDVVGQSVQVLQDTYQLAGWKAQAGTGSSLDVQSALANLEQTRASLPTFQQTVVEARNKLALLCGKVPGSFDKLLEKRSPVPHAPLSFAVGIPAETLRQRPDVRAAGYALQAAIARTHAAERSRFPSITLSGSIGVEALKASNLFSPETIVSNLAAGLTAPIFAGGSITQTIKLQEARQQAALVSYQSAILTALADVENALSSVQRTSESLSSMEKAEAAASDSAKLARLRYEAGDVDFYVYLDAQRTALNLEESKIQKTASLTTAYITLYKALGGGWSKL